MTGSLNASLGQWLIASGRLPARYSVAQGTRLQRHGRVHVDSDGSDVWVGGSSVTCIDGHVTL